MKECVTIAAAAIARIPPMGNGPGLRAPGSTRLVLSIACVLAASTFASASARAGMYDKPYAIVEAGDRSDIRKEARASVSMIDGKTTRNPRKSDPVEPGKHVVRVTFSSARGSFSPAYIDLEMPLEACTLYRVVAAYEFKTGPDWKPKVYSEPIGSCRKKFAMQ